MVYFKKQLGDFMKYTTLRAKIKVTPKYVTLIRDIHNHAYCEDYVEVYSFLIPYANMYRANFIPHGK